MGSISVQRCRYTTGKISSRLQVRSDLNEITTEVNEEEEGHDD